MKKRFISKRERWNNLASHNHWGISRDTESIKGNRSAVREGTQELFAKVLGIFFEKS